MAKKNQEPESQSLFNQVREAFTRAARLAQRDLTTDRLTSDGSEKMDPVPHAVTLGVETGPTTEDRIRTILRTEFFKKNPDFGLDSGDPDDFGPEANDPLYEFEKRHEILMERQRELKEAQDEVDREQKRVDEDLKEKRRKAYLQEQESLKKAADQAKDITPVEKSGTKA